MNEWHLQLGYIDWVFISITPCSGKHITNAISSALNWKRNEFTMQIWHDYLESAAINWFTKCYLFATRTPNQCITIDATSNHFQFLIVIYSGLRAQSVFIDAFEANHLLNSTNFYLSLNRSQLRLLRFYLISSIVHNWPYDCCCCFFLKKKSLSSNLLNSHAEMIVPKFKLRF